VCDVVVLSIICGVVGIRCIILDISFLHILLHMHTHSHTHRLRHSQASALTEPRTVTHVQLSTTCHSQAPDGYPGANER
jgi:hypothetical protein